MNVKTIKTLKPFLPLTLLLLSGCFQSHSPAKLAGATNFVSVLIQELQKSGPVEEFGGGDGIGGNVYTVDISKYMAATNFPPNKLYDVAQTALQKWGQLDTYSSWGKGGGGNTFHINFGNHRSHAFVDVIAYPDRDNTRFSILIRTVE